MVEDTTTVEIKHDTWRALDIRKERGESFDDIIRRMIGELGPGVGEIKTDPNINATDYEHVPDCGEACMHYDMVAGETCDEPAEWRQEVYYGDEDDGTVMYLCDDHGGDHSD